jgi:hypothetical protein
VLGPHTASLGRERDVAVVQQVSTNVPQLGLVADLKVVLRAASDQDRIGVQRDCLEVRGEGDGRGWQQTSRQGRAFSVGWRVGRLIGRQVDAHVVK